MPFRDFFLKSSHTEDGWHQGEHSVRNEWSAFRRRLPEATLARSEVWQRFTGWQKKSAECDDCLAQRMP